MVIKKDKWLTSIIIILYMILISLSYVDYVYPTYGYMGFPVGTTINYILLLPSVFLMSVLGIILLPDRICKPSDILITITFWIIVLPTIALIPVISTLDYDNQILTMVIMILSVVMIKIISSIKFIFYFGLNDRLFWRCFYFLFSINMILLFIFYKVDLMKFITLTNIKDLYLLRSEFKDESINAPLFINYLFFASSKVFIPLLLLKGLNDNNKAKILLASFCQLYLFMVTGSKSIFLGLLILYIFWVSFNKTINLKSVKFSIFIGSIMVFSYIFFLLGVDQLINIIGRRTIIIPGMLTNVYIDYFSNHDFAFLGYSILSKFIDYSYFTDPAYVIGEQVFNRPEMSANVNYLGAAYADFGYLGILVFVFITALLYKVYDILFYQIKDKNIVLTLLMLPTWVLMDGSLITAITTHGLFWILVILICFPKEKR
ncbi:TPA: O-antigen polymerase [Photobacterium damselae]